jgi:hypothetical protein
MGIKGFIIRMLPFVGAFTLGLFIASFFVNIGGSGFNTRRGCFRESKRLKIDNEDLRRENLRLRNELEGTDRNLGELHNGEHPWNVPPPPKPPVARQAPQRLSR